MCTVTSASLNAHSSSLQHRFSNDLGPFCCCLQPLWSKRHLMIHCKSGMGALPRSILVPFRVVRFVRWQPLMAVHVPFGELPAANCTTPIFVFESVFPFPCSFNMAYRMNSVGRSPPKRQMEITAILTCSHIPSGRGAHQSVVTKSRGYVRISFFSRLLGAGRAFLQRGASSRIPLDERAFVWSTGHVAQAPGLGLPHLETSRMLVQKDECSCGVCKYWSRKGLWLSIMGELTEVQRGVLCCQSAWD